MGIGVRKGIALGSRGPTNGRKRSAAQLQAVTQIVESDRVGHLRIEHRDHMAPGAELPAHLVHSRFGRQFRNQKGGNEIAKLAKGRKMMATLVYFIVSHTCI